MRIATDRLLEASIVDPEFPSIEKLSKRDRHRLMIAVVGLLGATSQWKRLYGTTLTADERFHAIVIDARRRERAETSASLREMRERLIESSAIPPGLATLGKNNSIKDSIAASTTLGRSLRAFESYDRILRKSTLPGSLGVNGLGISNALMTNSIKVLGDIKPLVGLEPSALTLLNKSFLESVPASLGSTNATALRASEDIARLTKPQGFAAISDALGRTESPIAGALSKSIGLGLMKHSNLGGLGISRSLGFTDIDQFQGIGRLHDFSGFLKTKSFLDGFGGDWQKTIHGLIVAEFTRRWADDPLWFLIRELSPVEVPELIDKESAEVHEAVLSALEEVLLSSPLTQAMEVAVQEIPFLTAEQKAWLLHGLRHAQKGEWHQAVPPLILGFEGALHAAALDAKAIAESTGKLLPAEKIIKAIELGEAYEVFAIRLVFGGRGNAFRHGRPTTPSRDQALLAIVAIIGWIDSVLGTEAIQRLAHEIRNPLAKALTELGKGEKVLAD